MFKNFIDGLKTSTRTENPHIEKYSQFAVRYLSILPKNRKAAKLLIQFSDDIERAKTQDELIKAVKRVTGKNTQFSNALSGSLLALSTLPILGYTAVFVDGWLKANGMNLIPSDPMRVEIINMLRFVPLELSFGLPFLSYSLVRAKKVFKNALNIKLHKKDAFIDNGLEIQPIWDKRAEAMELSNVFKDFLRGENQRRYIDELAKGRREGEEILTYDLYKFRWVIEKSTRDRNGNVRKSYEHNARFGVMANLGFNAPYTLLVEKTGKPPGNRLVGPIDIHFKGAFGNIDLDKRFDVVVRDKHDFQKLMNPSITLKLVKLYDNFDDMVIEITDGKVCISFNDQDVMLAVNKYTIDDPEMLIRELSGKKTMGKLDMVLDFIETLIKFNDDNFKFNNEKGDK